MTAARMGLEAAVAVLRKLSERDLAEMKNYSSGLWSRRNLEALIDDLAAECARLEARHLRGG